MSISFSRLATVTCSTKRKPVIADGRSGSPATNLSGLKCVPIHPLSDPDEFAQTFQLNTLVNLKETFIQGNPDIVSGDILVVGSAEYPIRIVQEWPFRGDVRTRLVLEKLIR